MAFTQDTNDYDNITPLADVVEDQANTLKPLFDKAGNDQQTFMNTVHIPELESTTLGSSGADKIGFNSASVAGTTVVEAIEDNRSAITSQTLGEIPDNTLTEAKMAAEMKKQAGGVYPYNDGAQNATDIATNAAAIAQNAADILEIEEIRVSTDTTGSGNAYVVNTSGNFDFTLDGNVVRINPNHTNTGTSTIQVDSTTKNIRKFDIDSDAYVILEAEDIKKNNPTELRFDVSEDFFVLAPKGGGSPIKSIQRGITTIASNNQFIDVTITEVDLNIAIAEVTFDIAGNNGVDHDIIGVKFINSTTIRIFRDTSNFTIVGTVAWTVTEWNGVKSLQRGTLAKGLGTTADVTITAIDTTKSRLWFSWTSNSTSTQLAASHISGTILNSTTLRFYDAFNDFRDIEWQVIEFK